MKDANGQSYYPLLIGSGEVDSSCPIKHAVYLNVSNVTAVLCR